MSATVERTNTAIDATLSFFEAYNNHQVERMETSAAKELNCATCLWESGDKAKPADVGKAIWSGIDAFPDLHVTVQVDIWGRAERGSRGDDRGHTAERFPEYPQQRRALRAASCLSVESG